MERQALDILDLPGWVVTDDPKTVDGELVIEARYEPQPEACMKCGVVGKPYRHGTKQTTYRDSPIRGATVRVVATVQRYRCLECGETFLQPLGGMIDGHRMTERCADYVKQQSLLGTFTRVADHVGCDEKTVRLLAADYIDYLDNNYLPALPEWLGIDETQIDGKMRCVITDVGNRRLIEMLPGREKVAVGAWLARFPDRSAVKGVAIDMWPPYRDLAREMFPGVPVVVDKFHIVRKANRCMDKVRIRLGKAKPKGLRIHGKRSRHVLNKSPGRLNDQQRFTRDLWLENEPEMKAAYELKEAFYRIFTLPKAEAIAAYDAFPSTVPASLKASSGSC